MDETLCFVYGTEDASSYSNIILTIKDTKLHVPAVTLSAKDNQKLLKIINKVFQRSVYLNEYKTKSENKNTTNEYRYLSQTLLELTDFCFGIFKARRQCKKAQSSKTLFTKRYC